MADEASDTLGGGIRNWLGTIAFCSALIGAEIIREHGPLWVGITLIAIALPIYLSPIAWRCLTGKRASEKLQALEYLSERDSGLGWAIQRMAHRSAWGRWYSAQTLANSGKPIRESELLHAATFNILQDIRDGEIEVRGRAPGKMDFENIPRTHWRSSGLAFVEDPTTLWKMVIFPCGGAQIAPDGTIAEARNAEAAERTAELRKYDALIVDAYQFEKCWPVTDPLADKKRREFLRQARRRRLDNNEIRRLS